MLRRLYILAFLIGFSLTLQARTPATPDSVATPHWLVLNYDNDAHFKTDLYYTQGARGEYYAPVFSRIFIRKLFPKLPGGQHNTAVLVVNDAFTPEKIEAREIQRGDRPFAGYFYTGFIQKSYRPENGLLLVSELNLGVIGPTSMAEPFQTEIHKMLGDPLPQGWKNQIAQDAVLNYNLKLDKRLWEAGSLASLYVSGAARAGTLYNDLAGKLTLCLGATKAFRSISYMPVVMERKLYRKLQLYGFVAAEEKFVAYNATMQGGVFNEKNCAYTLAGSDLERLVAEGSVGMGVTRRKFTLEYSLYRTSPEFKAGVWHNYSRLKAGFRF